MKVHIGPYRKNRKISVRIDKYDTWNMNQTLALIIHPMLVQLKEKKHGSPYVDDTDVPEHLRDGFNRDSIDCRESPLIHEKWDYVMGEMEWAFGQIAADKDDMDEL